MKFPHLNLFLDQTETPSACVARLIGASELAAAIDLILPAAFRIRPLLTAWAASGLIAIMGLAAVFHLFRGELHALPINLTLGALAAFVVWGRFWKAPIPAR